MGITKLPTEFPKQILSVLKSLHPQGAGLHEPCFGGNEWAYLKECIDTRWVSYVGKFVDRFEKSLADFTSSKYAIATSSGTSALHVALMILDVKRDDEVLVPALTFAATANAIAYCGAVPHFVDSDERSLGIDPSKLAGYLEEIAEVRGAECFNRQTGRRIRALLPVHIFGHPVDLDALEEIARRFKLELIEDAAESLGSYYKGKHTGTRGLVSILSFNGNKVVTTGGGGAILTHDEKLAARMKHLTTTAKLKHPWRFDHDEVGFNYRLANINAAVGCAQLEQLPAFLVRKRQLAERYQNAFEGVRGVRVFKEPEYARSNYWLNALLLEPSVEQERDALLDLTNSQGVVTRPAWTLLNKLPHFKSAPKMDLSQAESLERRLICIPSSAFL